MLFGGFLLLIAAFLHRGRQLPVARQRGAHVSSESPQAFRSPSMRLGIVISFLVGVSSSLFGIGGGIIHVLFLRQGHVRLPVAASMGLGVLLGAQLGQKIGILSYLAYPRTIAGKIVSTHLGDSRSGSYMDRNCN